MFVYRPLDKIKAELAKLDLIEAMKPKPRDFSDKEIYTQVLKFFDVQTINDIKELTPELITPFCNDGVEPKDCLSGLLFTQYRIDNPRPNKKKSKPRHYGLPNKTTNYAQSFIEQGHISHRS